MVENHGIPIIFHCPECPESENAQGTTLRRSAVKEMLGSGEDIRIMGGRCGHISSMPAVARENLRKQIAAGFL